MARIFDVYRPAETGHPPPHRVLTYTVGEWERLKTRDKTGSEFFSKCDEDARNEMSQKSSELKATWDNTSEMQGRVDTELKAEFHKRTRQASIDVEEARKDAEQEHVCQLLERVRKRAFNNREDIRSFHGALLSEAMSCWTAQNSEKARIAAIQKNFSKKMDEQILQSERDDIARRNQEKLNKRKETVTFFDAVKKSVCPKIPQFQQARDQADRIKKHNEDLKQEEQEEKNQVQRLNEELRNSHFEQLEIKKKKEAETAKQLEDAATIRKSYVQDKLKTIMKIGEEHNKNKLTVQGCCGSANTDAEIMKNQQDAAEKSKAAKIEKEALERTEHEVIYKEAADRAAAHQVHRVRRQTEKIADCDRKVL